MSNTATRTVKSSTATKKESTVKKSTATETNEQRVARLERAATGTMTIATKAITNYRLGVEREVAGPRLMSLHHGAEVAMRNANEAAKAAGHKVPFRSIIGYLRAVEGEALKTIAAANPQAKVEKTTAATKPAKAVVKKAAPQPRSRKQPSFLIETINRADGSVDGHKAGCRDIAKVAKAERLDRSGDIAVSSKHGAWLDYNADFLAEAEGHEACDEATTECEHGWSINWLPCADDVPEFATAATKPARKVASKPAAQAGSGTQPKAVALVEFLNGAGWPATMHDDDKTGLLVVHAERDGEALTAYFIDNKQAPAPNPMPTFTRTDGSVVKLRNISAVRQQAAKPAAERPVKAVRTVVARKRVDHSEEPTTTDASRALPVDTLTADLENLNECLSGRTIAWRRSMDRVRETAIVLKVISYKPTKDGAMIVEFLQGVPSKHGLRAGAVRNVALTKITYA